MKYLFINLIIFISFKSFSQGPYNSLCWTITGNELNDTSYIYGTFHSQDNRLFQFQDGVEEAFDNAAVYAMELNMDSLDRSKMMAAMLMDSGQSLQSLLSKKDYKTVNKFFLDSLGISLFMFNKMQPILTTQFVVTKDLNKEQQNALDFYWFKEAKSQGKQLVGLETMEEQVNAFKTIPVEAQAKELVKAVKEYGKEEEFDMNSMLEIYTSGNLDSLMVMINSSSSKSSISMEEFNEAFLYNRNINMANRVEQYIVKKSVFMAVGAAHLPGENGVIELLRNKGYKVEPLN